MVSTASSINFAVIGHQDSWYNIERFVNGLRTTGQEQLSADKIKNIFPFIPPRVLFRVKVRSATGNEINGLYIDTFMDPDKLDIQYGKANIKKVVQAAICAQKEGASITTLGGFTSIVLEGNFDSFPTNGTKFTTGNTLTAAYIVKGVEAAAQQRNISIANSQILILGATGDIGMACTKYFKNKAKRLLLCARNAHRLEKLAQQLQDIKYHTSIDELLPEADIIICVASSTGIRLRHCKKNVLICDAGYPKNLDVQMNDNVFHGGMGQVSRGFSFMPDYSGSIYDYPAPGIAHGCILEAMVLAFENKIENYSVGRGNITNDKIEEIYALSLKHGITLAPFYNSKGLMHLEKKQRTGTIIPAGVHS